MMVVGGEGKWKIMTDCLSTEKSVAEGGNFEKYFGYLVSTVRCWCYFGNFHTLFKS